MHIAGIESDVFAEVAAGTVLVHEAEQIVLVTHVHHASAEARELLENFRNVFGGLISRPGFGIGEESR